MTAWAPSRSSCPVIMQSSRRELSGSCSSTTIPLSVRSASSTTCDMARSEFCHECTSLCEGRYRNASKKASVGLSAIRFRVASDTKSIVDPL